MKKHENIDLVASALQKLTDKELSSLKFVMPWQEDAINEGGTGRTDADGFPLSTIEDRVTREQLQRVCWEKFNKSPFVGPAVRGQVGRLTGMGFEIASEIDEIQAAVDETELDPRNRLYLNWPKYVGRAIIEGELFLLFTVHPDGFVEVDFIDPSHITGGGTDGVIYHPDKATFPLFYFVTPENDGLDKSFTAQLVPSINIAYYPDLMKIVKKTAAYKDFQAKESKSSNNKYNGIGGFFRFMITWDRSFVTRRNVSYLRTIIEWLNHYENLKKYEIDHKKSAGAYLWVVAMDDVKAFRTWLGLTDEERRKTGIMAKKTPGSTLVLPPGMTITAQNPKLPTISEGDTDIFHMVTGGLNEPEDIATGQAKGTFASVKASRGPMSDRTSDEISYFERFLRFDFYRAIFFLKNKVAGFPEKFKVRKAVDFKNQKPVFKNVDKKPEMLIEISFPVSELSDSETRAKAYLGVKHGSVYDVLGIPNEEIAKKLGFGSYKRMRLRQATEEERFPELLPPVDSGGEQLEPGVQKVRGSKDENGNGDDKEGSSGKKKSVIKRPAKKE
ncbi:MAG: hypothetical protein WC346_20600 [Methanogenium sp.]